MTARILLVRHGRSAHVHTGWIDAAGLRQWMAAYDSAGIAPDERPPVYLQQYARDVGAILCSDMARAVASAEVLAQGRPFSASELLRETGITVPPGIGCRLPLAGWALAISFRWILSRMRGESTHREDWERALKAAEWLEQLASEHREVLAVTHATFRGHLARALAARGWRCDTRWCRYHNWSAWSFVLPKAVGS